MARSKNTKAAKPDYLNIARAAQILGVAFETVRKGIDDGYLHPIQVEGCDERVTYAIQRDDLEAFRQFLIQRYGAFRGARQEKLVRRLQKAAAG